MACDTETALAVEPLHSHVVTVLDILFMAWFSLLLPSLILAALKLSFVALVY